MASSGQGIASKEELLAAALTLYRQKYAGSLPTHAACAPGRVNLIGEHTDYNEGLVFPMALPHVTVIVGARNGTNNISVYADDITNEENLVTFALPSIIPLERGLPSWANYVKGVINFFQAAPVIGFNAVIVSSVPLGAGLSSSAAIEVATFTFLEALTGVKVEAKEKTFICQKAEHVFAEMPCGIMDQYISIHGKNGHALLLDCRSVTHEQIPFDDVDVCVLITNSNVKHKLDGSEYPLRLSQCRDAAAAMGVKSLREATLQDLDRCRSKIDAGVFRRARHVISEITRTVEAAQALRRKDYASFGVLMLQSHNSLRDDFEVSTPELDELVNIAMKCSGVFGSRLTGAGFGGSTVTLVKVENLKEVTEALQKGSSRKLNFLAVTPSEGSENLTSLLHEILQKCSLSRKKSTMTQTKSLVK